MRARDQAGRSADAAGTALKFDELRAEYKQRLLGRWSDDDREMPPAELRIEASAVYTAIYERARRNMLDPDNYARGLGFAWDVAGEYLCYIKRWRLNQRLHRGHCMRGAGIDVLKSLFSGRRRAVGGDEEGGGVGEDQ